MESCCTLCNQPIHAIGAIVSAGNVEDPDPVPVCRRCASLPAEQRKRLRDQAMARMLTTQPSDAPTHRS